MHATAEHAPNWTRATCCGEVWHESCISRYARNAESVTHTFKCPQCKQEHHIDAINDWDASVVIERLLPEDDYSPEEDAASSSGASSSESVDEEESDEEESDEEESDEGGNTAFVAKRKTRSMQ